MADMKFTEYPTRADRLAMRNGVQLDGQVVSAAPGGGKWVLTLDKRWHKVRTLLGTATSVVEDNP
jgi:hypothetical protein